MPKKKGTSIGESTRHAPLGQVIMDDESRKTYAAMRATARGSRLSKDGEMEADMMDEKTSRRILALSQMQREEIEAEAQQNMQRQRQATRNNRAGESSNEENSDEDIEEEEFESDEDDTQIRHDAGYVTVEGPGLTADEERVAASMMGSRTGEERRNLADIILAKIQEKESEQQQQHDMHEDGRGDGIGMDLPPKVVEVSRIFSS